MFCSSIDSSSPEENPNAKAAATGSGIIFIIFKPAIFPAAFVDSRWLSLKYAGTDTTTSLT